MHDQIDDQAAAYVLGALTSAERPAFEAHVATCEVCAAEVRSLTPVAAALAQLPDTAKPGSEVRVRLLAAVAASDGSRSSRRRSAGNLNWMALAASLALAVALGAYAGQLRGRVSMLESRLRDATLRAEAGERQVAEIRRTAFEAQSQVAVLAAPDLARIDLAGQPAAPSASARAFWSRSRGLVFTALNLPKPPPGRAYQLWVVTTAPAPFSAGMLTLDGTGRVNARFDMPSDLARPVAIAVTLEPEGGVPSPTGDKYLVGLAN